MSGVNLLTLGAVHCGKCSSCCDFPAGVKSFLERFGERCQERSSAKNSPSAAEATPPVTPGTRLVQERLRTAHVVTATADLTLKQKLVGLADSPGETLAFERSPRAFRHFTSVRLSVFVFQEREKELAQIRSRFQKGNVWKNGERDAGAKVRRAEDHGYAKMAKPSDTSYSNWCGRARLC